MPNLSAVNKISTLFLIIFFCHFVSAQIGEKAEIKRIDAYCKTLDSFVKKYKSPHLVFADVSDYNQNKSLWRKYNSEKEFEKAREKVESYDTAYVWRKNNKVVMANLTLSSPSGDWAHYIYHYFREDGTLAKIEARLNTFYGNMTVLRWFYFNRKGSLLRKTTKYLDLETQKPKKAGEQDFNDNEVKIFKKTSKLPFNSLLRKRRN
jgi:hypothetical protein